MAKSAAKVVESATQGSFTSLKDSAFQQAGAHQTLESVARYALTQIKDFPKEVPVEAKDALYEGYRMKFDALKPATMYWVKSKTSQKRSQPKLKTNFMRATE